MRLSSKALAFAMIAVVPLVLGMIAPLHAAPLRGESNQAMPCEHNPHVDASLQVCITEHDGIARYQLDTVDGTHAELILSQGTVELRQSGPDSVRVSLGAQADAVHSAVPSGIVRTVYQDDVLSIDEVQEGALPPAWRIDVGTGMQPAQRTCTAANCSGGIQVGSRSTMQPAQKTCTSANCSGHIRSEPRSMTPQVYPAVLHVVLPEQKTCPASACSGGIQR